MTKTTEQQKFMKLVDELVRVPHAEIKAKLEEEKKRKKRAVGGRGKVTSP